MRGNLLISILFAIMCLWRQGYSQNTSDRVKKSDTPKLLQRTALIERSGADLTGVRDCSAILQRLCKSGTHVRLSGRLLINRTIVLPSNISISGNGELIVGPGVEALFIATNKTTIQLSGLKASKTSTNKVWPYLLRTSQCKDVRLMGCSTRGMLLYHNTAPTGQSYQAITGESLSKRITIVNCSQTSCSLAKSATILIEYAQGVIIRKCSLTDCYNGIQWWGGDSNPAVNGALTNPRWTQNVIIEQCVVKKAAQGGIWGSMGQNIRVANNNVSTCGDVGIDAEGCTNVTFINNRVQNGKNGAYATFWLNRNVQLTGNRGISTDGSPVFRCYNATQTSDNRDLTFKDNQWIGVGKMTTVDFNSGPVGSFSVDGDKLTNCRLVYQSNNLGKLRLKDVSVNFTLPLTASAVQIGGVTGGADVLMQRVRVKALSQNKGSIGFSIEHSDFNNGGQYMCDDCSVSGCVKDFQTRNTSANAGISPVFILNRCRLGAGAIDRQESGANVSKLTIIGCVRSDGTKFNPAN